MPLLELVHSAGALPSPAARSALADALTGIVLRAERAPDTAFVRDITWVHVHELPPGAAFAAGAPVEEPVFRLHVTVPAAALSDRRRDELIEQATAAICDAAGLAGDAALRVWVLVHELPDGRWGAGGRPVTFERLRQMVSSATGA